MDYKLIEAIEGRWRKKSGLLIACIALVVCFCGAIKFSLETNLKDYTLFHYVIIGIGLVLIIIFWLIDNKIILLPNFKRLKIGLVIDLDDEKISDKLLQIIRPVVKELNLSKKHPEIHINLLPINSIENEEQLAIFLDKNRHSLDTLITLKIKSGKENNEDKFSIEKFSFTGNFPNGFKNLYRDVIEISNELSLRNHYKNWEHVDTNSFNDKPKLIANLKDHILYYCGIYLLLTSREDEALEFLRILYNPDDSKISFTKNDKGEFATKVTPKNIAAGRLTNILINLLIQIGIKEALINNEKEKAIKHLTDAEKIMVKHPLLPDIYVPLAKLWYDVGNLELSKAYTKKLEESKAYGTLVSLNKGFYAMIENDRSQFVFYYKKLLKKEGQISNQLLVLEHLHLESEKFPDSLCLFDLAEAILTKICIDPHTGNELLVKYLTNYPSDNSNKELIQLCNKAMKTKVEKIKRAKAA